MPGDARADRAAQQRAAAGAWRLLAVGAGVVALGLLAVAEIGSRQIEALSARAASAHLDAVRAGAEAAAKLVWGRCEADVLQLAADAATTHALLDLGQATRATEADPRIEPAALGPQRAALAAHLAQWYAPLGDQRPPFDDAITLPATRRAQWLQAQYVASANPIADGAFAEAHDRWHAALAAAAAADGMSDLLLVRASDGLVVYDVAKTPIFQTSLLDGAFSDSRLAALFRRLRGAGSGTIARADFAPFVPARGQAQAFVGAPLLRDGEVIGVVIAAFDATALDRALSADRDWQALGLGDAGDVYLIGADGAVRSRLRRSAAGTTARAPAALPFADAEPGAVEYEVDGRPMLAAIGAAGFGDLGWRVAATRAAADVRGEVEIARRLTFVAAIAIAAAVTAVLALLVWWGALPLRHLAGALARLRLNDPRARAPVLGRGEAAAIALQVNGLLEQHRSERAAARQQVEREARALADAVDSWQPGEAPPRLAAAADLAPIGTALSRFADRLDDARRAARLVPPPAADALRAAAAQLRRDAERNLEALGAAEEATRHTHERVEHALTLAAAVAAGSEDAERAARAEQVSIGALAAALAPAEAASGAAPDVGDRALQALGSGAAAAAALVDELSVLAVNAALQPAADESLAESARIAVERAEQVGTELDTTLAEARHALAARADERATPVAQLATVERDLGALVSLLAQAREGVRDLGAVLRTTPDESVVAAVHAAVDSARRLRQTAELVASEAAAVAGGAGAEV